MKNISKIMLIMALIILGTTFIGCNDEEKDEISNDKRKSFLHTDSNYNNFLSFHDINEMNETIQTLLDMDENQLLSWERSKNFVSLRHIYNMIWTAEEKFLDSLQYIYEDTKDIPINKHSEVFQKFSDVLIEKNIPDDTEGIYYDIDISNDDYAAIVNVNGIVKIGNDIYQFKENTTKIILGGDTSKIPLLAITDKSNSRDSIMVYKKSDNIQWTLNRLHNDKVLTKGNYKVIIYHDFDQWFLYDKVCTIHKLKIRSLKKKWYAFNTYNNHKTKIEVNSSFTGNTVYGYIRPIFIFNATPFYFDKTWSYNGNKIYKKNTTATEYFFQTNLFPFFCNTYISQTSPTLAEYPKLYDGTFSVSTSDGVSGSLTF